MVDEVTYWEYTQEEIDENRKKPFRLEKINNDGTIADLVRTINGNFQNVAAHGGGPAGKDGASGLNGTDGTNIEYIYARCDAPEKGVHYPSDITEYGDLFNRVKYSGFFTYKALTWYDHPQGVTNEHKNEYVLTRIKRTNDENSWAYFETPVLWAHWGETGADGDGVEYIFKVSKYELTDDECRDSILKISDMDNFQKVIYQINDFYPGKDWFNNDNRELVLTAFDNAGIRGNIGTNEFETRWNNCFNMDLGWTDEPIGTTPINPYEYVAIRKSNTDENDRKTWGDYSTPKIWSNYSLPSRTFIVYCNTSNSNPPQTPKNGWWDVENDCLIKDKENYVLTPNTWSDTNVDEPGKIAWISYGIFDHTGANVSWSSPFRITGEKGENGADGDSIQFIYALTDSPIYPNTKTDRDELFNFLQNNDSKPFTKNNRSTTWYNNAKPIDKDNRTEYVWSRFKKGNDEWTYSPSPVIWSHWGEDGTDGDGIEYIFRRTKTDASPGSPSTVDYNGKTFTDDDFIPENWTDNPTGVSEDYPYEWVSIRKSIRGADGKRTWNISSTPFSAPALWAKFSKDGASSRVFIVYCNIPTDMVDRVIKPTGGFWNASYGLALDSNHKTTPYTCDALSTMPSNPVAPHTCVWEDSDIDVENTITYISSGVFSDTGVLLSWTEPQRITGERGERGADGSSMEFIYTRDINSVDNYPSTKSARNALFVNVESNGVYGKWYDHPQGVDTSNRFEYCASRTLPLDADEWIPIDTPFIWSHWGEDGTDGDGIEYVFTRTKTYPFQFNDSSTPLYPKDRGEVNNKTFQNNDYVPTGWTDNPTGVDSIWLYEWVSIRKSNNDENGHRVWNSFSAPALWAKFSKDGPSGEKGDSIYRKYAQYVDSWGAFGSIVSISSDGSTVTFKTSGNVSKTASTTNVPNGADEDHCIEVMSEKIGTSGTWSLPVIIARQFSDDEIESKVNSALFDANSTLEQFIQEKAGEQVSRSMNDYVKTSNLNTLIDSYVEDGNLDEKYVSSQSFTDYQSNADEKLAEAQTIAANSTFKKNDAGYLIYIDKSKGNNGVSAYKSIQAYYDYLLENDNLSSIGIYANNLTSLEVVSKFIKHCEQTFETTFTELATVKESVGDKVSEVDIIAAIKPTNSNASTIKAAITAYANDSGSGINLTADRITIDASHKLSLSAGTFTISANNLTVDASGNVAMSGTITATSGSIGGITIASNAIKSSNNNFSVTSSGVLTATSASITGNITATSLTIKGNGGSKSIEDFVKSVGTTEGWYSSGEGSGSGNDYSWITNALSSTHIQGGLVMTGNLFANDSEGNITAGIMGAQSSASNETRFFAGTSISAASEMGSSDFKTIVKSAPFSVTEEGYLTATKGKIGTLKINGNGIAIGNKVDVTGTEIGESEEINQTKGHYYPLFIGEINKVPCINIVDQFGNQSSISPDGIELFGSVVPKTAYLIGESGSNGTPDYKILKGLNKDYHIYSASEQKDIEKVFKDYDVIYSFNCGSSSGMTIPASNKFIGRHIVLMAGYPLTEELNDFLDSKGYTSSINVDGTDKFVFADPDYCRFYENGRTSNILKLSREGVELVGVGLNGKFKGFIITHRFNVNTIYDYGHNLRCLGMFSLTGASNSAPSINSYTFSNKSGTISSGSNNHSFSIVTPFNISDSTSSLDKIVVNLTGKTNFSTELSVNNSHNLVITITGNSTSTYLGASENMKVVVYNFGDFVSLDSNINTLPGIKKRLYRQQGRASYSEIPSRGILWKYNEVNKKCEIAIYTNVNVCRLEYNLSADSDYGKTNYFVFEDSENLYGSTTHRYNNSDESKYYFLIKGLKQAIVNDSRIEDKLYTLTITAHTSNTNGTGDNIVKCVIPIVLCCNEPDDDPYDNFYDPYDYDDAGDDPYENIYDDDEDWGDPFDNGGDDDDDWDDWDS